MTKDPVQTDDKESSIRVLRGGSWYFNADYLVVSARNSRSPGNRSSILGLRPVRNVREKKC